MNVSRAILSILAVTLFSFLSIPAFSNLDPELGDLIKKCMEFENNPQIKPFKTNIMCRGKRTFWELKGPDAFQLKTESVVYNRAEMKDNQFQLPEKQYQIQSEPSWLSCRVYREMVVVIPTVVTVVDQCKVLENMSKIGRDAFCKKVLEAEPGEPPVVSGKTYSTCPQNQGEEINLGADFKDISIKYENASYQGPRIETITDPKGLIADIGLSQGDVILFINGEKIPNTEALIVKLYTIKGKGEFKMVALKSESNQLFSHSGVL